MRRPGPKPGQGCASDDTHIVQSIMGLNKQKKKRDWCPDESAVELGTKGLVRCPTCNKRLAPRTFMQGDVVVRMQLPPHKNKKG